MPDRVIVAVKYTPVSPPIQLRKAVGGFLRYIHYRDKHTEPKPDRQVDSMLKYVAHRDRSSNKGLLFDSSGRVHDAERRELADFVARSVTASKPQLYRTGAGEVADRRRAVYRFVLSPEHDQGLDLQQLTCTAMGQLETDAGGQIPWIAAEHRNTSHPHVHIVMAGLRQEGPGQFRSVILTRPRLARMKAAVVLELQRQRELRPIDLPATEGSVTPPVEGTADDGASENAQLPPPGLKPKSLPTRARPRVSVRVRTRHATTLHLRVLRALAARYRWQNQQLAEEERRRYRAEGRRR
jgi:hypothetical protein